MPNWSQILEEVTAAGSTHDVVRRKYLAAVHDLTGRNVILYYSGWLQLAGASPVAAIINDQDKNGFMAAIHELDRRKGLDLILHTPGGDIAATESLVDYLRSMFGTDIRAIIPQIAMSGGTMIALACGEIIMGKHSSLGPIDPVISGIAAHGLIEEFKTARQEIARGGLDGQAAAAVWQPIIAKYPPTFVGEAEKAIKWSEDMVKDWLKTGMLADDPEQDEKVRRILDGLGDHALTLSHSRHISLKQAQDLGLNVVPLEDDDRNSGLQDAVLAVHHIAVQTIADKGVAKIIENHRGVAQLITPLQRAV